MVPDSVVPASGAPDSMASASKIVSWAESWAEIGTGDIASVTLRLQFHPVVPFTSPI
jgi:hypothetical protein